MSPDADNPEPDAGNPESDSDQHGGSVIRLDSFIKISGLVGTGGEAKQLIQAGEVRVNGEVELRRRKQLWIGDIVEILGHQLEVDFDDSID